MHVVSQKNRLLTAAVGLPVIVAVVLLGGWPLWVLLALGSVLGVEEYFSMAGRPGLAWRLVGDGLAVAAVAGAAAGGYGWSLAVVLVALWIEQFDFLGRFAWRSEVTAPRGTLVGAVLYVPTALGFFCRFSPLESFFVLSVVFAVDTGAYYGGHLLGGPKVWPAVSPGKTVSGSLTGLACGALVGIGFGCFLMPGAARLAVLGALMAVVAQFGDFFESALKRAVGVKDSGRILPGHGGMLDRIDGLLPAVLVYAACRLAWGLAG
jgi:phosphatidate cytidylyltransferase